MKTELVHKYGGFDQQFYICADYDLLLKIHEGHADIKYLTAYFAYFDGNGVSNDAAKLSKDLAAVISKHLSLTKNEVVKWQMDGSLPLRKMIPYAFSSDEALNAGARSMIKVWCRNVVRRWLWPIVLLRRKIRAANGKDLNE